MIKPVGQAVSSAVEALKLRESGKVRSSAAVSTNSAGEAAESGASPVARMAAEGAPVDFDRVAAIKTAIASGNYPVDASRIAEKMIALDLPVAG